MSAFSNTVRQEGKQAAYFNRLKPWITLVWRTWAYFSVIVTLPKAIAILRKYDYNLNLMSNQKCNDQLKQQIEALDYACLENLGVFLGHRHVGVGEHLAHGLNTHALCQGSGSEGVAATPIS